MVLDQPIYQYLGMSISCLKNKLTTMKKRLLVNKDLALLRVRLVKYFFTVQDRHF